MTENVYPDPETSFSNVYKTSIPKKYCLDDYLYFIALRLLKKKFHSRFCSSVFQKDIQELLVSFFQDKEYKTELGASWTKSLSEEIIDKLNSML